VRQRQELARGLETQRGELLTGLQEQAQEMGFALQMTPQGIMSAPIQDGKPIDDETFGTLPEERRQEITAAAQRLDATVQDALLRMRALEREAQQQVRRLDDQVAAFAVEHHFQPIVERWGSNKEIAQFTQHVRVDIVRERERFRANPQQPAVPGGPTPAQLEQQSLRKYEVNVLVSRGSQGGAPVVFERHPTYYNLIGRIEYSGGLGAMSTNHMQIRPGSLLLANGGFIVLRMRDLLLNPQAYDGLKRALAQRAVAIENLSEVLGIVPTLGLRPEPIPLDVKVAIVGDGALYAALYRLDPDFRELFRVKADFEVDFERTQENIVGLASIVRLQTQQNALRPFRADAVARLVEHASRVVEDQRRLSANMGVFGDIIRQADFWAGQDGSLDVQARHVERALEEHEYRSALLRDRMQQLIDDGSLYIATDGEAIGQINALSVYDVGDMSFGRPSRITCVTGAGRGTIVNVERETEMSGRIHNKGFMILRGFLAARFGQDRAMSLHASLTFEQLYGEIDGDSASSTELYALLSSLSGLPIKQSIAVTGSVNQHGEVQPIGGATAKIEGFYEVCRERGLDGTQGVMIPHPNVPNVVLRPEVAQAVADGKFNVWSVSTIEQGIELLTGVPAGVRGSDHKYPEGTVFRRVEDRLDEYEQALRMREGGPAEIPHAFRPPVQAPTPPGIPPPPPPPPPIQV
jgi:predicted ATP-dependent protease